MKDIKSKYLGSPKQTNELDSDADMRKRIDYAIDKVAQRDIFNVDIVETLDLASPTKRHPPSGWLREFSSVNMEVERSNFLKQ